MSETSSPLPLAGGVGGGHFQPRNTKRAKELRATASPAERKLWRCLSGRKLARFKFCRQMPVGPYFADFLCREAALVVELDGFSHELRQTHDAQRDAWLASEGFSVLRFTNADVMGNLDGVILAIGDALEKKCPPPTPPASGRGAESAALPPSRLREGPGVGSGQVAQGSMGTGLERSVG